MPPPPIAFSRPLIGDAERAACDRVLSSGALVQGREVELFEREFAATVGGRHCVAVSSGTAALHLGLLAAGIGAGDEVIVPSFTFVATANAVVHCGATPVFVDIDVRTYCLDPTGVEAAITERTVAVLPVHLYGHPADMEAINLIASRRGLLVMEDACQAQGAASGGRAVGDLAPMAAVSFYPTKTMTTIEGGMLICESAEVADEARSLRNQGLGNVSRHIERIGYNARMTDVAAAIGRVQLARVPEFLAARRANASLWDAALRPELVPHRGADVEHAFSLYTIRCDDRPRTVAALTAGGIGTGVYYDTPLHRCAPYEAQAACPLPCAEAAASCVLSLPVGPHLTREDTRRIAAVLRNL